MNEDEMAEFVADMMEECPELGSLSDDCLCEEAVTFAMATVDQFEGPRWFGAIGNGTFYCDTDAAHWFPNSSPPEALGSLKAVLGEVLTEALT